MVAAHTHSPACSLVTHTNAQLSTCQYVHPRAYHSISSLAIEGVVRLHCVQQHRLACLGHAFAICKVCALGNLGRFRALDAIAMMATCCLLLCSLHLQMCIMRITWPGTFCCTTARTCNSGGSLGAFKSAWRLRTLLL